MTSPSLRARFSSCVLRADPYGPRLERKKVTVAGKTFVQYWIRPVRERDRTIERRQHRHQSREEVEKEHTRSSMLQTASDAPQHSMPGVAGRERPGSAMCTHTCRIDIRVHTHGQNTSDPPREPPPTQSHHGMREMRVRFRPNASYPSTEHDHFELGAGGAPPRPATSSYEASSEPEHDDPPWKEHTRPVAATQQEEVDSLFAQMLDELERCGGSKWESLDALQWDDLAQDQISVSECGYDQGAQTKTRAPSSNCCVCGSRLDGTPVLAPGVSAGGILGGKTARGALGCPRGGVDVQGRDLGWREVFQHQQMPEPGEAPPPYSLH